ncbi:MAG: ABC transporter ATP-binding protein [Finegoldia sp.]|nr:ABC transporter ATP-binding protein [Finegoldia sp.]
MIKFENVSKIYTDKLALDNLNLEIEDGKIFGLIGHNGAGKSTTIKSLVGIIDYEKGDIYLDGINIKDDPISAKKKIGYVADSPDMFLKMTPYELWRFIKTIYEVSDEDFKQRVEKLTEVFDLKDVNQTIESFSHGMRQKIFLIATLLTDPDLWVMDEPLTGLDPQSSYNLKEMMREHADKGNTVLFSTHILDIAEKLCDRIGILKEGKLIFLGSMEDLKKTYPDLSLEEIYLNMVKSYEDLDDE